jgi:Uma2 family endonuclease
MLETPTKKLTEEEFMALPDDGRKYELVDGEVKEVPTGGRHGELELSISWMLKAAAKSAGGRLFGPSTGFQMAGGNIRSPDVSFMKKDRLPGGEAPEGFIDGAPDLAIEIISPSENRSDMLAKVIEYLDSGAQQVWHVFPEAQRVVAYRSLDDITTLHSSDTLEASDLLPGFQCRVSDLFA